MRIVIEGNTLEEKGTGVSRYLYNLLDFWIKNYSHKIYILIKKNNLISRLNASYIYLPYFQNRNIIWQQLIIPRVVNQIDKAVYFAPNYTLPLCLNKPSLLAVHDLSFFLYKQHSLFKNILLKALVKKSIEKATKIVSISHFIKKEILQRFQNIQENKIEVVYLGCQSNFLGDEEDFLQLKNKYQISSDFLLSVGLIFNRRQPVKLLRVFKNLISNFKLNLSLVIIGENRTIPKIDLKEVIHSLNLNNRVILIPYVEEKELISFYRYSRALIYFSEYEGFGLPIVEALANNKKVICSDIEVFRELYGDACFYVNHKDDEEIISEKIYQILNLKEPIEEIKKCLLKYNWSATASYTMKIIESLI